MTDTPASDDPQATLPELAHAPRGQVTYCVATNRVAISLGDGLAVAIQADGSLAPKGEAVHAEVAGLSEIDSAVILAAFFNTVHGAFSRWQERQSHDR
jgi:hypothetical protein